VLMVLLSIQTEHSYGVMGTLFVSGLVTYAGCHYTKICVSVPFRPKNTRSLSLTLRILVPVPL